MDIYMIKSNIIEKINSIFNNSVACNHIKSDDKYPRKIVTLCGSTKFKNEFEKIQELLTLDGYIVLSVGFFSHEKENSYEWEKAGVTLELLNLHKQKIMMSDEIFVINKDGYIGPFTKSEIEFAKSLNIPIKYLENK